MFVPSTPAPCQCSNTNKGPDWTMARKLFVPKINEPKRSVQSVNNNTIPSGQSNSGPDWDLERKLFVPNFRTGKK